MLILGASLTILGFVIFWWSTNAQNKSAFERPMIFNRPIVVLVINLFWVVLLVVGFYSLWKVNPKIILALIGIYAVLWMFGYFLGSEKSKAKKIFKIYKQLKLFRPKATNEEIFRETANAYFRGLHWDEHKIKMTADAIFEKRVGSKEDKDIKDVARSILIFESSHADFANFGLNYNSKRINKMMKRHSKKQKAIDDAYNAIIGNAPKITERPELSKKTTEWIKSTGLNPEEMSNEQLAVFSEIDDNEKSNKVVRFFYYISFIFILLTFVSLITLDFVMVLINAAISFVLWLIGYKIQMRRISKKFYEASIIKYAQEQVNK